MIQPFIEDISKGEISCIYINGINTHNMIRNPGIFTKKQRPYYIDNIPYQVKMLSDKVSKLDEFKDCLYLRVDIVMNNNRAYVMEVEAAEPDLLFKYINNEEIKEKGINMLSTELVRRITK